jgi:hypothetical protein
MNATAVSDYTRQDYESLNGNLRLVLLTRVSEDIPEMGTPARTAAEVVAEVTA